MIDTEEQMQPPSCCAKKDTYAISHRDFLLEILLIICKYLIHNMVSWTMQLQETNWKQKFQKTKMKTSA